MSGFPTRNAAIADELRRSHSGDAWHGPAVANLVHGLTAVEAASRPVAAAHTIWEIVLHVTAWRNEVARRLVTGAQALPEAGDWPPVPAVNEENWRAATAALAAATETVIAAVAAFPEERLGELAGEVRDPAIGSGFPWATMLHGLAQHDAYHGGQIAILTKALAGGEGA